MMITDLASLVLLVCLSVVKCAPIDGGVWLKYREDLETRGIPLDYQKVSEQSLENGRFFEGDLAISPELIATRYGRYGHYASIATAGIKDRSMRWPEGKMFYELDSSLSSFMVSQIKKAMDWWSQTTCIQFEPRTSEKDYVHIQSTDSGCYSDSVGRLGGKQLLNLQKDGCMHEGTIAHELGHNIGLWHEQSRYDRDKYINVMEENIKKEDLSNFDKLSEKKMDTEGLPYDYDSVMHYNSNAFSKNGKDTIQVINKNVFADQGSPTIGQRDHLSKGDIAVVNRLYECPQAREEQ